MNIKYPDNNGLVCRNRYIVYISYEDIQSKNKTMAIEVPEKILNKNEIIIRFKDIILKEDQDFQFINGLSNIIFNFMKFTNPMTLEARAPLEIFIYEKSNS